MPTAASSAAATAMILGRTWVSCRLGARRPGGTHRTRCPVQRERSAAVQRLDGPRQDALRTGQVVSRAITDLQLVQSLLSMAPLALGAVVLVVASIAAMLWLSPLLTLVALVVVPTVGWIALRTRAKL